MSDENLSSHPTTTAELENDADSSTAFSSTDKEELRIDLFWKVVTITLLVW